MLFIGEMNCPTERDQIRNWFGFLGSVFFLLGATSEKVPLGIFFFRFVSLVTLID